MLFFFIMAAEHDWVSGGCLVAESVGPIATISGSRIIWGGGRGVQSLSPHPPPFCHLCSRMTKVNMVAG